MASATAGHALAAAAIASRVFTVPPGRPFLDCVAAAILSGSLPDGGEAPSPMALSACTLLLPTRRAVRAMREAFLRVGGGRAMLLPQIRPISEGDEDLALLADLGRPQTTVASGDIGPAIGELERRLALTELVLRWSRAMAAVPAETIGTDDAPFAAAGARTPAQAIRLAADLSRLIDLVETEGVSLERLQGLVPDELARHWQVTLDFLRIVVDWWPAHLTEHGLLSPADRRNRLIRADAARLASAPPAAPVIVAGVTGSVPATVDLMRAVVALPAGAIVLPALDLDLDEAGWQAIRPAHPEHPQFGLATLLDRLGLDRREVRLLPGSLPSPRQAARARLVSEAMRPAATTDRWTDFLAATPGEQIATAMAGVALIEAPTATDEAEVVALILREAVETPGRTAVLVSPDRRLARRVAIRLEGMGIAVDDSAGRPFAKTPVGTLLDLILETVARAFTPEAIAALLKHPLTRLGLSARERGFAARALEIAALRTVYLGRGLVGLDTSLARAELDRPTALRPEDWQRARLLAGRLRAAFEPLTAIAENRGVASLQALVRAHVEVAEAVARLPDEEHDDAGAATGELWAGEAGQAAAALLATLLDDALPAPAIALADYPDVFRGLVAGENVRSQGPTHPRVAIWGPFEARLQRPDVVVLGSLNDGTWPEAADPGPWLNRPMRQTLGLPQPEERIGYAAHDVTCLLGADQVYMTRALKVDGVPTVASRWLLRLSALLEGAGKAAALTPAAPWLAWAARRDVIDERRRLQAPTPRPPLALRPRRMSVSDVERWIANPYAIFARRILGLEAMPALGAPPDAALRGSVVHAMLAAFSAQHPRTLPPDPERTLLALGRDILEGYTGDPHVAAFWIPRLERFARWFAETERERRKGIRTVHAEIEGQLSLAGPAGPFLLHARADRIDDGTGGLVITDYKTGAVPSTRKVAAGLAPQLPLEAAIALQRGFAGVQRHRVRALRYVRATGGDPAGEQREVDEDVGEMADQARRGLEQLVARFDDINTPYRAVRRAAFSYDYDDYAHLARVDEWSDADSGDPDEEG